MGKQTQIEKAIASIDGDIQILQAAKARLQQQQVTKSAKAPRKPRAITAVETKAG